MRFFITTRGFFLPFVAGVILLFQNWIPAAREICIAINFFALLIIALDYFSLPDPSRFNAERILPDRFFHDIPAQVDLRLSCESRIALQISVLDRSPETFIADSLFFTTRFRSGIDDKTFTYNVTPRKRGPQKFGMVGIRIFSSLGLIGRQFKIDLESTVQVFPQFPTIHEGLQSQFYVSQLESRIAKTWGAGREFHQMRDYRRGDDVRMLHWKRSARSGKLIVREFQPERGQNVFLLIDGGRLMMADVKGKSKVDRAVSSVISVSQEALKRHDSVGTAGFSNHIDTFRLPSNRKFQFNEIVRAIYSFQPSFIEPDYGHVFSWIHTTLKQRCIIIVYTDFVDPYLSSELCGHLLFLQKKHRIICCAMGDGELQRSGYKTGKTLSDTLFSAVVRESIDSRRKVLGQLRRAGIDIVDVEAENFTVAVLNAYARARWG
jgi:uncharacterized protein (DUF58 family)